MRTTGHYQTLGNLQYFIPDPLPPKNPPLMLDVQTTVLYGEVMLHLGKLNEAANKVPDIQRFIKAYVIKEALLSSSIEGIHTTLLNVFTQPLFETTKADKNTQLVLNYTKALYASLSMIKQDNLPITIRVILAAHETLMTLGEDDKSDPGHFRKQAVRVGRLVPPPAQLIPELFAHLERFINADQTLPPLIKAGLAHVQFETIHPFLDGNGRIGRLLIVLMLIDAGILQEPIVYPSYYFKKHSQEYYQTLDGTRTHGDFETWIIFYLTAMKEACIDAYKRILEIEYLKQKLEVDIKQKSANNSKAQETRMRALAVFFDYPIITIDKLSKQLDVSFNTADQIISMFIECGFLEEITKQKRGRLFMFKSYMDILEKEF